MKTENPTSEAGETITLTVGTAGHIDHGKTELVKYLTGCNTDRLPEEQSRGMTIDLGFATCELPDHRRVGIVDVPGHERFIHNMVAGAAGIDVVILVVAADDGVMPQTIEHFHIVRLLGVSSGMVVVTKTDLVTEARVSEVIDQVKAVAAGSFLEGCPVIPFSSKTGAGFDGFYEAFVATVDRTAEREADGPFRLHVERAFVLKGLGTIVSGIPRSGSVATGETLELLPACTKKRVRGIQVYGQDAQEGKNGECVALKMSDLSRDEIGRGMVLATPGFFSPARFVNVRLYPLPELEKPLEARTAVRFHIGTDSVPGHLALPSLDSLAPGTESYAQLQLKQPVVAAPGDFFIVRLLSPVRTIGGGYVVSAERMRMRRSKGNWLDECREREEAFKRPASTIRYVLQSAGPQPLHLPKLAHMSFMNEKAVRKHIAPLVESGEAVQLAGDRYVHRSSVTAASDEITDALNRLHDENPLSIGFEKKQFFPVLKSDRRLVDRSVEELVACGDLAFNDGLFQLPSRAPSLSQGQLAMADRIVTIYRESGFVSPRREELPEALGAPASVVDPVLEHLVQTGEIVVLSEKVILHRKSVEISRNKLVEYLEAHGELESGAFKGVLGTTRKYSIPILEYWDAQGLTTRVGNKRRLRHQPSTINH